MLGDFFAYFFQKKFFQNFQVVQFTPPRMSEAADIFVQLSSSADSPRKRETKKLLFEISQIVRIRSNIFLPAWKTWKMFLMRHLANLSGNRLTARYQKKRKKNQRLEISENPWFPTRFLSHRGALSSAEDLRNCEETRQDLRQEMLEAWNRESEETHDYIPIFGKLM